VKRFVLLLALTCTIACDRVTKHVAMTTLAGTPGHSYFGDTVRLSYAENTGGFLSLGTSLPDGVRTFLFTGVTGVLLIAMGVIAFRRQWDRWSALGLVLFVSGGASNWIDRALHGRVADFLNVGIGSFRTGIFNVADVALMGGALLLAVAHFRRTGSPWRHGGMEDS